MSGKNVLGTKRPFQTPNPESDTWNRLRWAALEQQVLSMQKRISQASQRGNKRAVHILQQQLLESEAARLVTVRHVTQENQGKDTAGIDGVKSLTAKDRLAMVVAIHPHNWSHQIPQPARRVWIPKGGTTEKRPLAILPMIDRCKQALVKLALEPEWEAKFESQSYGFRPERGTHDAIAAISQAVKHQPVFVFEADIEGAFDNVRHEVVLNKLNTYPALRQALAVWLKAGVMDGNISFPTEKGLPQGSVLLSRFSRHIKRKSQL